ncbi:MAG: glycerophosphodiester phosphodiesterase [Dorea sp.]
MRWLILLIVIFALYLFFIWPRLSRRKDMHTFFHTMFAHRGYHCASKGIPENSMISFREAVLRGYGIELDIHLSKDGKLVVFHDDTLERMCGRQDVIEELTAEELTRCRLQGTNETIPLFSDVLSMVNGQVPLLIELKMPSFSINICKEAYRILKNYPGPYMVQSFNPLGLRWFRKNVPDILRGQLSSNLTSDPLKEPWIFRFTVKHLMGNFLGRPDFISYKLKDLPTPEVWILKNILHVPVAVWTLRTPAALADGQNFYDMQIFEKQRENY